MAQLTSIVDIFEEIRGPSNNKNTFTSGIYYDLILNPNPEVPTTGNTVQEGKGILGMIKEYKDGVGGIKDTLYGTDTNVGSAGTVLANITAKNDNVNNKSTNVDAKSAVVDDQFTKIAGTNGDGTENGMYYEVVDRESKINPHYQAIDNINNDINAKDTNGDDYADGKSKLIEVGTNIAKGNNSELVKVGEDLISDTSTIKNAYDKKDEITAVYNIREDITQVTTYKDHVQVVGTDLADDNSDIKKVSADLKDVNSKVIKVGEDLYKEGTDPDANDYSHVKHAAVNAITATTKAQEASTSAANAATSENAANTSATNAATSEQMANKWAINAKDLEVVDGKYSAYHWAMKAADVVGDGVISNGKESSVLAWSSAKTKEMMRVAIGLSCQVGSAYGSIKSAGTPVLDPIPTDITKVAYTTVQDSTRLDTLVLDDDNDEIVLKKNARYIIAGIIVILSHANEDKVLTVEVQKTSDDSVVKSTQIDLTTNDGEEEVYAVNIPIVVTEETRIKLMVKCNEDGMTLNSFEATLVASEENTDARFATKVDNTRISDDDTLADASNADIPTERAVKVYTDAVRNDKADKNQTVDTDTRYKDKNSDDLYKLYMDGSDLVIEKV